jgi:hypothetical protein
VGAPAIPQSKNGASVRLFRAEAEIERYDVTPDGTRFLASTPVARVPDSPQRVIVNWPAAPARRSRRAAEIIGGDRHGLRSLE